MIINAEIIGLPPSGQFHEKIFDIPSVWNSHDWVCVKFTNEDLSEWCGQFRGGAGKVALSKKLNMLLVLTSDYLYQLDCIGSGMTRFIDRPQYIDLTVSPDGDFIIADSYNLFRTSSNINEMEQLHSPVRMEMISFGGWNGNKLEFGCDEFLDWGKYRHLIMEYDSSSGSITIKDKSI